MTLSLAKSLLGLVVLTLEYAESTGRVLLLKVAIELFGVMARLASVHR